MSNETNETSAVERPVNGSPASISAPTSTPITVGLSGPAVAPKEDASARAAEDGRPVGRILSAYHFPVVKEPTGVVQFAKNRAEVVTIERLGDVRRAQVIAVSKRNPPTSAALDFARGLVASGNFSHVAADTPLGQPEEYSREPQDLIRGAEGTRPEGPDLGIKVGDFTPSPDSTPLPMRPANTPSKSVK